MDKVCVGDKEYPIYEDTSVMVKDGRVFIDGIEVEIPDNTLQVKIYGNPRNVTIGNGAVAEVFGNVQGNLVCTNSVKCHNVYGYVSANGNVICNDVQSVRAGEDVCANNIQGLVKAGGRIYEPGVTGDNDELETDEI